MFTIQLEIHENMKCNLDLKIFGVIIFKSLNVQLWSQKKEKKEKENQMLECLIE